MLLVLLVVGCATQPRTPRPDPGPSATYPAEAVELLDRINAERARGAVCGGQRFGRAAPVRLEPRLTRAAALHSADMHRNGFMGHAGSDGSTVGVRVTRQGYEWSAVAENVAFGYRTPEAVMQGWMASPGHCAAIMGPTYSELGAAEDGNFWTLVFAEPR